jgi:hypothetical protein
MMSFSLTNWLEMLSCHQHICAGRIASPLLFGKSEIIFCGFPTENNFVNFLMPLIGGGEPRPTVAWLTYD